MAEVVLDVKRVAARLGVGDDKVRAWLEAEEFPNAFDVGGASRQFWRIPLEDVDAFIERRRQCRRPDAS